MKRKTKYNPAATPQITEQELDAVTAELDELAKSKLRDGCLEGILHGYEPEIRQQAILITVGWWIEHQLGKPGDWIPKQSISYALRYSKLRQIELLERRNEHPYNELKDTRLCEHPQRLQPHDYPEHTLLRMLDELITKCLLDGSISKSNSAIARMSYMNGMTISEISRAMRISTSAVNQQLCRVRRIICDAAKTTDPTFLA
jgi:predicted RNA polymerase sigma factor